MRKFYDFGIISDFRFDIIIDLLSLVRNFEWNKVFNDEKGF